MTKTEFDAERFKADVNFPSEEQVERAAMLICLACGRTLDMITPNDRWEATTALILHLNKAKWQIGL